jgi:hypothetical protein
MNGRWTANGGPDLDGHSSLFIEPGFQVIVLVCSISSCWIVLVMHIAQISELIVHHDTGRCSTTWRDYPNHNRTGSQMFTRHPKCQGEIVSMTATQGFC